MPTPEQCVDHSEEGPLLLELLCNRCGLKYSRKFDWACVNPNRDPQDKECDGILLSRIVECAGCGAVDDYTLADRSLLRLTRSVFGARAGASSKGRIILGVSKLWDGSIPHRPSHALARLRRLAAEHPDRAEAFRRLGNACERWGLMGEAVTSWKKALDLDPADVEAAYSLATYCWGPGDRPAEGLAFLRRGLQAIPKAAALGREVREWGTQIVRLLPDVLEGYEGPLALMAVWSEGELKGKPVLTLSSIDLGKVDDFERLAEFVTSAGLLGLDLTSELPQEEPTRLQYRLSGYTSLRNAPLSPTSPTEPQRSPRKVGRNAPCPCGSGKKHKRCCGSST